MLLMKEGDPATHARIHFLMDHTQVFVVFSFFSSSQMTNYPFLGEGRETVTAAVANGIDELLNKGNQSLLDHVNCQHFLSLSLDHPYRHKSSLTVEIMSPSLFIYHMSSCHMSSITCHLSPTLTQLGAKSDFSKHDVEQCIGFVLFCHNLFSKTFF